MFRRRGDKEKAKSKGSVADPFGLELDPGDLKFDESALERELADMMGSDDEEGLEFEDEPVFKARSPRPNSKPQPPKQEDSDDELIKQLQSKLDLDDGGDDDDNKTFESHQFSSAEEIRKPKPIAPPVPSSPTPITNENLQIILDRKRAFESAIHSLSTSHDISDADSACLRRYERLLTSINAMASKAQNNIPIDLSELPPPPPQPRPNAQPLDSHPSQHASAKRKTGENIVLDYITGEGGCKGSESKTAGVVKQLKSRLMEYRAAVAVAQKEGDKRREVELMVAVNALVESIPQIESGVEEFDEDSMPPPPHQFSLPPDVLAEVLGSAQTPSNHPQPATTPAAPTLQPQRVDPAVAALTKVAASTVASKESLMARIQMLKAMIQGSNDLQKRMYQRALDNYSKGLRAFEAGIKYDYGGLPPLPGCPQFTSAAPPPKRPSAGGAPGSQSASASPSTSGVSSNQARTLELLQKRQAELRSEAAHCKSTGDIAKAKEYLRQSLGMNNMIRAVQAGLPVDLKQLPPAPGARAANSSSSAAGSAISNQPILSGVACDPPVEFQTGLINAGNDPVKICDRIIAQLEEQVKEAETLSKDHREAGLSNLADKFYDLADVSLKWISLTKAYKARNKVPHYSFEKANLSRLNMNPELGDNVLEVTPLRGISFPVPSGINGPHGLDTYVTIELPFPSSENPQKHSTEWARHTNEPTDFGGYQASARFEVNRKARSYERLLKGVKALKVTVFYNRGLLKKPAPLGTITVKLTELIANATHTACYELMDGRKAAGGLLELRIRHRTPLEGTKFSAYEKPWVCVSTSKR
nr:CC2D1B protein [Hymenolepis microstoma]